MRTDTFYFNAVKSFLRRVDERLDKSVLSGTWQRWKWALKYRLGKQEYVPDFDTLVCRPHRKYLLDAIDAFGPWRSALEVGCGKGANLYLLANRHTGVKLAGVDVSLMAIEQARAELSRRGVGGVRLEVMGAIDLRSLAEGSFDVVFSDAVLMYVPPADISAAIDEMVRVARLGVVVSAWHQDSRSEEEPWWYNEGAWIYDYRRLLEGQPGGSLEVLPYPEEAWANISRWRKYGCLIRLKLNRKG